MSTNTNADKTELNRRQTIKLLGIAAAAGGASGVSSAEVKLPDDPDDIDISWQDVYFNPLDPTSRFNIVYGSPVGATLTDMALNIFGSGGNSGASPGDIAFHNTALSAFDGWTNTYTLIKNYLKDLPTTMNIRARSAVADAYKAGKTQSEAQQAVADAVYSRADTAARNAVVSKMTLALQLANISATAKNTTEVLDIWENTFFGISSSSYSGSGTQVPSETGIVETEVTESITLPSGDATEIQSVKFEIGWDNGDGATFTVSDLLSNYITPTGSPYGEFELTTNNGETLTDDFTGTVPSLPSANLASRRCINMAQLGDIYDEIETKASTVIDNYGATFVNDIYNALNNGTITTGQLRGAEGLASLLSGSTDATESRFQLALSTLYDIPRPDLSEASYMEVELDGWTDESIRVDTSGNRSRILKSRTKKPIPYRGQMFAKNVSTDLKSGESYLFNVPVVSGSEGNSVTLLDVSDGSETWENSSVHTGNVLSVAPFGSDKVLAGSEDNSVALLDASDGSQIWKNSSVHSGGVQSVAPVGSDRVVSGSNDDSVALLDASDGSKIWQNAQVFSSFVLSVAQVGSDRVVAGSSDNSVAVFDVSDGSKIWQNTQVHSNRVRSVAPVGSDKVVSGTEDGVVALFDASNGSKIWQTSIAADFTQVRSVAPVGPDRVVAGSKDNSVTLLDASDGSEIWKNSSVHTGLVGSVAPVGSDRVVSGSNDNSVALLDASDGSKIWQNSGVHSNTVTSAEPIVSYQNHIPKDHDGQTYFETYDGLITGGFFGGVNLSTDSDEFEEVPIRGTMKILSMQDSDGNSVDQITTDPLGPPEYEQLNNTELANRLDKIEKQLAGALEESGNQTVDVALPGFEGPGNILDDLPSFPGFSTVESVIIAVAAYLGIDLLRN